MGLLPWERALTTARGNTVSGAVTGTDARSPLEKDSPLSTVPLTGHLRPTVRPPFLSSPHNGHFACGNTGWQERWDLRQMIELGDKDLNFKHR